MHSSWEAKRNNLRPLNFMDALCVSEILHGFYSLKIFLQSLQRKKEGECSAARGPVGRGVLVNLEHPRQVVWDCGALPQREVRPAFRTCRNFMLLPLCSSRPICSLLRAFLKEKCGLEWSQMKCIPLWITSCASLEESRSPERTLMQLTPNPSLPLSFRFSGSGGQA